jgi:DNA-binding MarR family transcriptional regulator
MPATLRKRYAIPASRPRAATERRALLAARALVDRMRDLYRGLERLTGAPIGVHRALACIHDANGISASGLADALGMRRPAVSHILNGLAERGWVERLRSVDDQRSVRLYLTAEGRRIVGLTAGRAAGTLQRAVRALPSAQLQGLAIGLESLLPHVPELVQPERSARARAPSRSAMAKSAVAR